MSSESAFAATYRPQMQTRPLDLAVAGLAERQYGVVSRAQLIGLGMSESAIKRRLRGGRLHVLHPAVYAVGHRALPREGRWLAAVLRGGEEAVLSHRSAAELWGILRGQPRERIDIATPSSTRSTGSIRRHCLRLAADEVTLRRRIPVTTLTRTICDMSTILSVEGMEAVVREAEYLHRLRPRQLEAHLERHPGQRGAATVATCLRRLGAGPRGRVRSRLEARFASLLSRSDLPQPELNALLDLGNRKVQADCLWSEHRVIVELDGRKAHGTRVAFEGDRERDRRLQAAGWRVVHVTWRQLDEPEPLIADLRRLLSRASLH